VIVQFGGQTPLNLSLPLKKLGVPIIGTDPENIDLREDRKRFGKLLDELNIPSPPNGTATSEQEGCGRRAQAWVSGLGPAKLRAWRSSDGHRL
jgi:carbamoyl-phosphate synthase large subunit